MNSKALRIALATSLLLGASQAQALVITADATARVGSTPAPGVTDSATGSGNPPVEASAFDSDATIYSETWATTAGDDNGWMWAWSGGTGTFSSTTSLRQSETFTNTFGAPAAYTFDFTISAGSLLTAFEDPLAVSTGDFVWAGYSASILLNGTPIWSSAAELYADDSGINLATNGTVLGSYTPGATEYFWPEYSDSLFLGVFDPGETLTIEYLIKTFVVGVSGASSACGYEFGFDGQIFFPEDEQEPALWCGNGVAMAQFGDPNGLSAMPITPTTVHGSPVVAVSEPGAMWLLMAGLLGLTFATKRHRRDATAQLQA